jgi:hypothetical protein
LAKLSVKPFRCHDCDCRFFRTQLNHKSNATPLARPGFGPHGYPVGFVVLALSTTGSAIDPASSNWAPARRCEQVAFSFSRSNQR